MQGKKNYQEKLFTCFQLSERVPEDNIYRRLKDVLDLQWLYKATSKYYGTEGQRSIDPVVFFKLILVGYLENLCSDRRIINTVSMRLDILYFIGYDIDEDKFLKFLLFYFFIWRCNFKKRTSDERFCIVLEIIFEKL